MQEFKSLFPEFIILTISLLAFIGVILYFRLHRKSMSIFYLLIFAGLYAPAFYYVVLGSRDYVEFGVESLRTYMLMSTMCFVAYSIILALAQRLDLSGEKRLVCRWNMPRAAMKSAVFLFSIGIVLLLTIYLFIYRDGLPLYQAIFKNTKIGRPDGTGAVPHWFIISAFLYIAFPCFYLYYHEKKKFSWFVNLMLIGGSSFYMVLGGNKGFIVYWFLFLWVYLWDMKLDARIVIAGGVCFVVLLIIMGGTTNGLSLRDLRSGIDYGVDRFLLTQGAMLVNRFEMIAQGFDFDMSIVTNQVFTFIYKKEGGSGPAYFIGDMLIRFGLVWGFFLHLLVFSVLAVFGRWLDCQPLCWYRTWLFFCVQYFLGMNSIAKPFLLRLLVIIALWIFFSVLESHEPEKNKKRSGMRLYRHGLSRSHP